jgi:hypothetical protein
MQPPDRFDRESIETAKVDAHVRVRPRPPLPGSRRSIALAALVVVGAVAAGLALRGPDAASVGTELSSPGATAGAPTSPPEPTTIAEPTPAATSAPDASPTPADVPTPQIADPTTRPPTAKPTPDPDGDPGPTDAPHPTWTPPAVFTGSATMYDYCYAPDGTEQVMVKGEWNSPVLITGIEAWLDDGSNAGASYFPSGDYSGFIASSISMPIGSTRVATVKFLAGPTSSEVVATRVSEPYTAQQGSPCPTN